jgi:hypothetical protein
VRGSSRTYYDISADQESGFQIDLISFICVGETTVASESYSGTIRDILEMNNIPFSMQSSFYINTINNARSSSLSEYNSARELYGYGNVIPHRMYNKIKDKIDDLEVVFDEKLHYLPTIVLRNRLSFGNVSRDHHFSTVNATLYGCTKEFDDLMSDYKLSELPRKINNTKIKYKKKRKSVKISFK